jgi:hypothetical protein
LEQRNGKQRNCGKYIGKEKERGIKTAEEETGRAIRH